MRDNGTKVDNEKWSLELTRRASSYKGELQSKCSRPCHRHSATIAGTRVAIMVALRAWHSRFVLRVSPHIIHTCVYTMWHTKAEGEDRRSWTWYNPLSSGLIYLRGTRLILAADPFYLASRGCRLKKERKGPGSFSSLHLRRRR